MLGYWIVISTQTPKERDTSIDGRKSILAQWETSVRGIDWLETQIEEGDVYAPPFAGGGF